MNSLFDEISLEVLSSKPVNSSAWDLGIFILKSFEIATTKKL